MRIQRSARLLFFQLGWNLSLSFFWIMLSLRGHQRRHWTDWAPKEQKEFCSSDSRRSPSFWCWIEVFFASKPSFLDRVILLSTSSSSSTTWLTKNRKKDQQEEAIQWGKNKKVSDGAVTSSESNPADGRPVEHGIYLAARQTRKSSHRTTKEISVSFSQN